MNETIVKNIDIIAEGHKTIILKCFADGMPKPIIAWYKVDVMQLSLFDKTERNVSYILFFNNLQDNVLLVENDQYLFKFNYQELHIKYFKQHDSGRYSCHAINRLGTNEAYQHIMIKNAKRKKNIFRKLYILYIYYIYRK